MGQTYSTPGWNEYTTVRDLGEQVLDRVSPGWRDPILSIRYRQALDQIEARCRDAGMPDELVGAWLFLASVGAVTKHWNPQIAAQLPARDWHAAGFALFCFARERDWPDEEAADELPEGPDDPSPRDG